MDTKRLGQIIDELRGQDMDHDADVLQFGIEASGEGHRCRLCGVLAGGDRNHRCWIDSPLDPLAAITSERDALRRVVCQITHGCIGRILKDGTSWWHMGGFIHGPDLLDVLRKAVDGIEDDGECRAELNAVTAALTTVPKDLETGYLKGKVGAPGVRDPQAPCDVFTPMESPPGSGDCETDGHYLCSECRHISLEALRRRRDECPACGTKLVPDAGSGSSDLTWCPLCDRR